MNTVNKEIEYKNYKFNIKVEFNTMVERTPNGKIISYCNH